tara:strand:+ start:297 stop:524 length:228 start_codon:yes stop_codon:yes gene_type:complete
MPRKISGLSNILTKFFEKLKIKKIEIKIMNIFLEKFLELNKSKRTINDRVTNKCTPNLYTGEKFNQKNKFIKRKR